MSEKEIRDLTLDEKAAFIEEAFKDLSADLKARVIADMTKHMGVDAKAKLIKQILGGETAAQVVIGQNNTSAKNVFQFNVQSKEEMAEALTVIASALKEEE
ncbi:hypothetical protein NIES4074_61670 (plasmid) [Cylindrospermum sp. NIES-4074]|nr:hypothetical protein NIES4074_61670 [Cylindrospermum sp. NIES-4074]